MFLLLTVVTGVVYPFFITAIAQVGWPVKANGGLIDKNGKVIGSDLIGQEFSSPKYFWGRLSATTPPYNAASSGGSNLGPLNHSLLKNARQRMDALLKAGTYQRLVPIDLVTSSSSGLDPDISVAAAEYQIPRIARARTVFQDKLKELLNKFTEGKQLGCLGETHVNVLKLNMALDELEKSK